MLSFIKRVSSSKMSTYSKASEWVGDLHHGSIIFGELHRVTVGNIQAFQFWSSRPVSLFACGFEQLSGGQANQCADVTLFMGDCQTCIVCTSGKKVHTSNSLSVCAGESPAQKQTQTLLISHQLPTIAVVQVCRLLPALSKSVSRQSAVQSHLDSRFLRSRQHMPAAS